MALMTAKQREELVNGNMNKEVDAVDEALTAPNTEAGDPGPVGTTAVAQTTPRAAVAVRQATLPSTNAGLMDKVIFADRKDVFVVDYGTLPRVKADNGGFCDSEGQDLGKIIKFQVMSFNSRWTVTPGDKAAPIELLKFSLDGKTMDDGSGVTVSEHLADLKKNWPKARAAEYMELVVNLVEAEHNSALVGNLVQLQLSPSSKKEFENFQLQTSFKMAQGLLPATAANVVLATAKKATNANKESWTKFTFSCAI